LAQRIRLKILGFQVVPLRLTNGANQSNTDIEDKPAESAWFQVKRIWDVDQLGDDIHVGDTCQVCQRQLESNMATIRNAHLDGTPGWCGGQLFGCLLCQEFQYSYHSCRNRHCPKCQHEQTQAWLEVQRELLLPVPYFMLTFTLPSEMRELASRNQKLFYSLLFRASAQATQKLAQDPRYVGGQIGLVGVLHTWTRHLFYHPHVHYLAPGGGLGADGKTGCRATLSTSGE
jgi:hypothetical protein